MEPTNELVYIVDDEANVGEALSTLLRANGKRVQVFTSGQDFLDYARRDSCACLILDLKMPGLSGLEVQRLISANTVDSCDLSYRARRHPINCESDEGGSGRFSHQTG